MTIESGTIQYQLGTTPVTGCGRSYSEEELDTALAGPVAEVVFENSGKANIESLLAGLAETDFEKGEVERIWSVFSQITGKNILHSGKVTTSACFEIFPDFLVFQKIFRKRKNGIKP